MRNPVTAEEVIQIGDVIRRGVLTEEGTAEHPASRRYELKAKDGAALKVIIDFYRKKDENRSVINFYSDRKAETGAHNVSSGNITDPNINIVQNGEMSRESVDPEENLRTKRLVDMMMPVVGSFVDQESEYYAKKMHDAYNVDISPAEALLIAREAWRARRKRSIQRNWQMAYEYFRQANPVFDLFMEFSDEQQLNPGTIHFII